MFLNLFKRNLSKEEIKKEIVISIVISYITVFVSVLISFLYTPFLLKNVGSSEYGVYSFSKSIVNWFSVLTAALCSGYIKFATDLSKKDEKELPKLNGIYLIFFAIISLLIFLITVVFLVLVSNNIILFNEYTPSEKKLLVPVFALIGLNSVISIFVSYFSLHEAFKERFVWARLITLTITILNPAISVPFILLGNGIIFICFVQIGLTALNLFLLSFHAVIISKMRISLTLGKSCNGLTKAIISFSLFALFASLASSINSNIDKILLGFLSTPTNVTIYQIGLNLVSYLNLFAVSISNSTSTMMFKVDKDDAKQANALFNKISSIQLFLCALIIGGYAACGKEFMTMWVGPGFIDSFYVGLLLFVVNSVPITISSATNIVKSRNLFKKEAILYLLEALLNTLLSILFLNLFPKTFAVYSCTIATVITFVLFGWIIFPLFYDKKVGIPMGHYYETFIMFFIRIMCCLLITIGFSRMFSFNSIIFSFFFKGCLFVGLFALSFLFLKDNTIVYIKSFLRKKKKNEI